MIAEEAARLARRLLSHEEQAFLDFQRVYRRLFLAIFRGLGLAAVDAEDLAASTITDICLMVEKWDPTGGNFDGWVRMVARNKGLIWLREAKGSPTVPIFEGFDRAIDDRAMVSPSRADAVHDALGQLAPSERVLIELRELEFENETPYAQIADVLERLTGETVSAPTLRVRHARAMERLRKILTNDPRIRLRELRTIGEQNAKHDQPVETVRAWRG